MKPGAWKTIKSIVWEGPDLVITTDDDVTTRYTNAWYTNAWFSEGPDDNGNLYDGDGNMVAVVTKVVFKPVSLPTKDIK